MPTGDDSSVAQHDVMIHSASLQAHSVRFHPDQLRRAGHCKYTVRPMPPPSFAVSTKACLCPLWCIQSQPAAGALPQASCQGRRPRCPACQHPLPLARLSCPRPDSGYASCCQTAYKSLRMMPRLQEQPKHQSTYRIRPRLSTWYRCFHAVCYGPSWMHRICCDTFVLHPATSLELTCRDVQHRPSSFLVCK